MKLIIINIIFAFIFNSAYGMSSCIFPKAIINTGKIVPLDFINSQAKGITNDLRPRPIINTRRIAPVDFVNPQFPNLTQRGGGYFPNFMGQQYTNNEFILKNSVVESNPLNPINSSINTTNLSYDFFVPETQNVFLPNFSSPMNQVLQSFPSQIDKNVLIPDLISQDCRNALIPSVSFQENQNVLVPNINSQENQNVLVPNINSQENQSALVPDVNFQENHNILVPDSTFQGNLFPNMASLNLSDQKVSNKNIVWRIKKKIKKSKRVVNLAFFSPTLPSNIFKKKSELPKASTYFRKKNRKEKYLDELLFKNKDVWLRDMALVDSKTKIERQVCMLCRIYDQTKDINEFFNSLTSLPLISVVRSQKWLINRVLDIFETANSVEHSSRFLKIVPKRVPLNVKGKSISRVNYNVFGHIVRLCSYENSIRAYNLYTPIILEQQDGIDIVSALQTDCFAGKPTKMIILDQIYNKALERQREGNIPDKVRLINNDRTVE